MERRGLRLDHRIVIPFALVAVLATSATAYIALRVSAAALTSRVTAQVRNAAALVSQSDFALNPAILRSVKAIAGADAITIGPDGRVVASTFDGADSAIVDTVAAAAADAGAADAEPLVRRLQCGRAPCYVAYSRVAARPGATIAIVASTSELDAATRAVTRTIVLATAVSLVVMVLVSQAIARRISAPLDRLVAFTREIGAAGTTARAEAGDGDVGRLGRAFNDMLDRLDESQAARVKSEKLAVAGLVAARAAHDIRNPLSSIKMQTQLLRAALRNGAGDRGADVRPAEILDSVLHNIAQVESAIRDLLELARPGELRRRPTSVNPVVSDVLQQFALQLAHRKIAVEARLAPDLPDIPLDVDRFKHALSNVVSNAADAMTTGGTLVVRTLKAEDGSTVEVDVCDDGDGVDPAVADRVFDPFVSTKRDGVGLGLVNARAVVESHGGAIALAPRTPRGTQATITLPVRAHGNG